MVYKRSFDVWSRTLPQTEVLNDFTEKNSMKLIHEFFIDEFIYQNREDKYPINTLFDMYNKYLLERKKDINISESIFRHEVRQFLTKDSYHPKNVTHYTTTKDSIKDNLSKRKITNEMIEARKPHEEDFEEVFCNNDYDPVERLQADNLKLTNRIHEQNKIIEEQKKLIENLKKMLDKTPSEENAPKKKKKVSQVVNKEWDKLKSII